METTTSVAAVAAPSGNVVDNAISKLLDNVIGQMFSAPKWSRETSKEGVVGMITHASGDALNETSGEVLNLISYSNGKSSFTPSVEVQTAKGIFVANVQGSLTLKAGQKVTLAQSTFTNKKGEVVPCLIVVK
jgi:hypothetical protein